MGQPSFEGGENAYIKIGRGTKKKIGALAYEHLPREGIITKKGLALQKTIACGSGEKGCHADPTSDGNRKRMPSKGEREKKGTVPLSPDSQPVAQGQTGVSSI